MADTYDVIVIGAGPGGYVAAIRAGQLGLKTAIVEREHLGGICLNWGCIPTKALLRSADVWRTLQHLKDYGFAADNPRFDLEAIVKRSRGVATQLSNGVKFLMKKNKIAVIDGTATLKGQGIVSVTAKDGKATDYAAKNIILASGARARQLPGLEADGKLVWSYKEAMVPPAINTSDLPNTLPTSIFGTISRSALPATGLTIPLCRAASSLTALSSAKGPSTMTPRIWPLSFIFARAAASIVAGMSAFTVSTAASTATRTGSTPNL